MNVLVWKFLFENFVFNFLMLIVVGGDLRLFCNVVLILLNVLLVWFKLDFMW